MRVGYIDIIRGLMLFWVLVNHISLNYGYITWEGEFTNSSPFMWMSFFMIPFYVFSGYFFSHKKDFKNFVSHKFQKLIIPYITFSILGLLFYFAYLLIVDKHISLGVLTSWLHTGALSSNTPCWFFISLFSVNIIYYIVLKFFNKFLPIFITSCFLLAYLSCNRLQILGYGNILLGLVYFHFGKLFKEKSEILYRKEYLLGALTLYIIIGVFDPQRLSFVLNNLKGGGYFLNLCFSLSATYILWYIAKLLPGNNKMIKAIQYLGQNSLVLFASHRIILNWFYTPIINAFYPSCHYVTYLCFALIVIFVFYFALLKIFQTKFPYLIGL